MGTCKRIPANAAAIAALLAIAAAHEAAAATAATAPVTSAVPPAPPPRLVEAEVRPLGTGAPRFVENPEAVARARDKRGVGVYAGPLFWFDLGGDLDQVGRQVGLQDPPGGMLTGFEIGGWFAPHPAARLGAWLQWLQDERREGYVPSVAGDEERGLATRYRGGGVHGAWRWRRGALGTSVGGGVGLGDAEFTVKHRRLHSPGSYVDYARMLHDASFIDSWSRSFSASGPLARLDAAIDYGITNWFRVGLGGSFTMHYLPAGNWVDDLSGGQLDDPPTVNLRGVAARLELSVGRFPERD